MRITNRMMINNSMANIQINKNQMSTLDTQLSTQKKINKPSEDPIIAIRALRLRSSLEQVTQYLDKNIPDASSWLSTTQSALDSANSIINELYNYCSQGSTDSYSSAERKTIVESLEKLKITFYSEGNVDYSGRYIFTGYNTDKTLTYQSDADASGLDYTITQKFTREDLSTKTVFTNAYSDNDVISLAVKKDAQGNVITPNVATVYRLRTGYSDVKDTGFELRDKDGNYFKDQNGNDITTIPTTTDVDYNPTENEIIFNAVTGELLLGENMYKKLYTEGDFSFTYQKDNFKKDDLNPIMYYDCVDNNTGIKYEKKDENINYNINFAQELNINTEAKDAFNMYLGRDVDEIITTVQNAIDVEDRIERVKGMLSEDQYKDEASQEALNTILEGLNKQADFAKNNMTNIFESGIKKMKAYQSQLSEAKADVGNRMTRLNLTRSRLTEQKTNFKSLKSQNEDIDLEEVVVNYTAAQLVYNASLSAASKVVQQTLLDFL